MFARHGHIGPQYVLHSIRDLSPICAAPCKSSGSNCLPMISGFGKRQGHLQNVANRVGRTGRLCLHYDEPCRIRLVGLIELLKDQGVFQKCIVQRFAPGQVR